MGSSSFFPRFLVCIFFSSWLVTAVFCAAITVTFTGGTNYGGTNTGTCPFSMTAGNDYTFNSNSATVSCVISGNPSSVTFGSGGTANTYVVSGSFSQTSGTLSVDSSQSVTFSGVTYSGNVAVSISGTLNGGSATTAIQSNSITIASTGTLQTTSGSLNLTPVADGNPLSLSGTIASASTIVIGTFTITSTPTSQITNTGGFSQILAWGTSSFGKISAAGAVVITPPAGTAASLTFAGTIINTSSTTNVILGSTSTNSVVISGPVGLNGGPLTVDTANGGTVSYQSAVSGVGSVNLPSNADVTITSTGSFGVINSFALDTSGSFTHAGLIASNSSSGIDIKAAGTTTITGVIKSSNPTIGANAFRIRPTGASVSFSGATIIAAGEVVIGNSGATTYSFTSTTINVGAQFTLSNPTTFASSTIVTPNWNVQISGGSSVAGPSGTALPYTFLASSNAITSSLFPSGINTNCIWVQAPTSTPSFAVTLPNAIQYRNYVQASPNALTVTSTNGGAVTRCAPLLTSVLDRRNDVFKNNLVYFGGNAVFYFVTSQALPFGTVTASDFTVSGGSITSITSLGGSPTAFAIVVSLTCDGVVSLSYNGSLTGNGGNFLGISASSADRVVNAKCIANIYAPCG